MLFVDASDKVSGALLMQGENEMKKMQPDASRKSSDLESKYSATERERQLTPRSESEVTVEKLEDEQKLNVTYSKIIKYYARKLKYKREITFVMGSNYAYRVMQWFICAVRFLS
ncbi:hypothetical protein EVAR_45249_1 [Eumeta japonica]|uniref:Uncharacterized protein n=1 Tax=Eumeta variegata TaxID=151549 RepID=A0A4C1XDQ2_EUMVA|nr:hypothetical protein EVAR_45249_1 [Eumeta japonica]